VKRVACCALLLLAGAARAQLEPQPSAQPDDVDAGPPRQPVLTKAPELLATEEPIYPDDAKAAGRQGEVVLRITIDAEGLVERLDVVQSAGADPIGASLDWAAMGAAANFAFAPAEFDGKPGRVAVDYKTGFVLETIVETVAPAPDPVTGEAPINFEGVVREAATKVPLEGVVVEVEIRLRPGDPQPEGSPQGFDVRTTQTDEDGRFSFRGVPAGAHRVSLSLTGYEASFVDEEFAADEKTELVVYLDPRETNAFETVVRKKRARKEVAKVSLSRDEVRRVPGTFGDPLRVIENLPGLARAPFIGGALIVRGASPQDTGVYFDGVEIPQLYHFGGLTSVVNAEFLEDIAFFPGGFGARYGRATAGIVDVSSRKLKMKNFRGYAELDLLDSGFFFGGPVQVGALPTVTFAAAARRSYIDALLPIVLDTVIPPGGQAIVATPIYWDYQLKAETSPLPGHDVSVFGFGADDDIKVVAAGLGNTAFDLGLQQGFHRVVGRWDWRVADGVQHRFQPFVGRTTTGLSAGADDTRVNFGVDVWNWGLRDELSFRLLDGLVLETGIDYLGSTFDVAINAPIPIEIGSFPRLFPRVRGQNQSFGTHGYWNATGLWLETQIAPFEGLLVVPGVRGEFIRVGFLPDTLPDGTKTGAAEVELTSIDPRLATRLTVLPGTTLKGAIGTYRQPPQPQELTPEGGNPALLQPRSFQVIGGVEQDLLADLSLDLQVYYTHRDLQVQGTGRTIDRGDGEFDPLFYDNGGRGRSYGLEILLRQEITRYVYGWIAYTLSRSELDLRENRDRFEITEYDQTHILTIVAQGNLPYGFTMGGRFRLVSGNPTSLPLGSVHDIDTDDYVRVGSSPRSSRLPTFHQLDVRVDRKWVFEAFSVTAYMDLLNVYNQTNAEAWQSDYRSNGLQAIPSLPILPIVGLSGEF
jgi:TonB family protein